jgi:flagellar biosynthesis GTPase FlhF
MIRQLGQLVMQMEEVAAATDKVKAQSTDMFERTLKPGIPFIVDAIKYIGIGLRGLVGVLDIIGTAIGATVALITNPFKKETWAAYRETMAEAFRRTKENFVESSRAIVKQTKDQLAEMKKLQDQQQQMERKRYQQELADKKKAQEEYAALIRQSRKDTEDFENAWAEEQMARFNKIQGYYNQTAKSLADVTTSWLNGEKDAWKNWADDLIKQIERVILKRLFLNLISGIFGGAAGGGGILGDIFKFMGGGSSARPGGGGTIQIITADPATTVRFVNNAYGQAGPSGQAGLYRNVQRGAMVDTKR